MRNDQREFVAVNLRLVSRFEALDRVNAAQRA
jgi:hypothetical protein